MEIQINGQLYRPRRKQAAKTSKMTTNILAMAMLFGGIETLQGRQKKEKSYTLEEIAAEYELIQQKKSSLSRRKRDWVEYLFKENFELIKPSQNL